MHRASRPVAALIAVAVVVAACSAAPAVGTPVAATPLPSATAPASTRSAPTPDPGGSAEPAAATPAATPVETAAPTPVLDQDWATAELVDAATGSTFRIADFAGRVVILETMAIWCTNCRAQQQDVYRALEQLDPAQVMFIGLDVDPSETTKALATYRERYGFTGTYAVAGRAVARALVAEFGDLIISPPSTPMILIGSDGRVTLAGYGHKGVDELLALARDHGA